MHGEDIWASKVGATRLRNVPRPAVTDRMQQREPEEMISFDHLT